MATNVPFSLLGRMLLVLAAVAVAAPEALAQRPAGAPGATLEQRAAQMAPGVLTGTVLDDETGEPIAGASVAVWSGSTLVTGTVTDLRGAFHIERLRPGTYRVAVSFLGYRAEALETVAVPRTDPEVALGAIRLAPDTAQLDAVEVAGQRETVEIRSDRTVYNVRDEPVAETGTVSELLQQIPSVEVDIDGNVSLRGNQNVAILIDGRTVPVSGPFLAALLRQMPASSIERVEVIPNPSARFDPEGMGGILNIVTRQDAPDLGLSGGVTLGGTSTGGYNGAVNLGYQRGRYNATGSYGFRRDVRASEGFTYRENRFDDSFLDQVNTGERTGGSHLLNGGLDVRLGGATTLGVQGLLSIRHGDDDARNAYLFRDAALAPFRRYTRDADTASDGLNADGALTFRHVFRPQTHQLSGEVRYGFTTDDSVERFRQQLQDPAAETPLGEPDLEAFTLDRTSSVFSAQVDYERPLPAGLALETGSKVSLRRLDNALTVAPRDDRSNTFAYDEDVFAVYGLVTRAFGPIEAKAGARAELARTAFDLATTAERFEREYASLFPSAFVTYRLSDVRQLRASYSLRIDRPNTHVLNPFTTDDDPLNLRQGNPFLEPEYTHAVEAGFSQFLPWGSFQLNPYFRRTENAIARTQTLVRDAEGAPTGTLIHTFDNAATRDSYGAEVILAARPARWLQGFLSGNAYRYVSDAGNIEAGLGAEGVAWSVRGNAQLQLPHGFSVQGFGFYRAPMNVESGRIASFSMTNLSVRKQLLDERASLTLQVRDLFDTMGFSFTREDEFFYQMAERRWDSRAVTIGFTYNFGQAPRRQPQRPRGGEGVPDVDAPDFGMDR